MDTGIWISDTTTRKPDRRGTVINSAAPRGTHAHMRLKTLLLALVFAAGCGSLVFVAGCGSKGALYLPEGQESSAPASPPSIDSGIQLDSGEEIPDPKEDDKDDAL